MSTESDELGLDPNAFTQYAADVRLPAFRFTRGGEPIYTINPTLEIVLDLLPKPDPTKKFTNNRLLNVPHARAWGNYWEKNEDRWGCPAGLVSTPSDLEDRFSSKTSLNGMQVGVLSLPRDFAQMSEILDMQHRIYGWHDKRRDISERLLKLQNLLRDAEKSGQESVPQLRQQIADLKHQKDRFSRECITVEIAVMSDEKHRRLFSEIASKALAINATQIADFDDSQAINRVARAVQSHPLLDGRVDWDKSKATDTKRKPSTHLLAGANLADLVRPFALGHPVGRAAPGRNEQLAAREQPLTNHVSQFLTALTESFPEFAMADDGTPNVAASDVRESSLLGSSTMLRALATAYYKLTRNTDERDRTVEQKMTHEEVVDFFKELAPHMGQPVEAGNGWLSTKVFPDPSEQIVRAPGARSQEIKSLADQIENWALGKRETGPLAETESGVE